MQFDARVKVQGPSFAEDPMNVPIAMATDLPGVQRLIVLVDKITGVAFVGCLVVVDQAQVVGSTTTP